MKTYLLFALLSPLFVFANDTVPMGRAVYEQRFDLAEDSKLNGTAILLFNREASVYINADAPKSDQTVPDENPEFLPRFVGGDPEGFPIYKNHRTRRITFKTLCYWRDWGKYCILEDSLDAVSWTIHPDQKTFGTYTCTKATGYFRGRDYEAWFSPEIPIPSGPFKFGNLPGLILEMHSLDGLVHFYFKSLEMGSNIPGAVKPPKEGNTLGMDYWQWLKKSEENREKMFAETRAKGTQIYSMKRVNALIEEPE
ncbi:MAG: GLPGLI family protein [Saprospiraceae bacterium]|nr:GLPGLI family protein [Saprospiraceae bacterium]